jgi:hypothetical protein
MYHNRINKMLIFNMFHNKINILVGLNNNNNNNKDMDYGDKNDIIIDKY